MLDSAPERPHEFAAVRREFPILETCTYLNTAANGLLPEKSRQVMADFFANYEYVDSRTSFNAFDVLDDTRQCIAQLLRCEAASIALTFNTSHALNIAIQGLPYQKGDNVVMLHGEFPANVYPWRLLESRGVEVRLVPSDHRQVDLESLEPHFDSRTRAVGVTALSFHDGHRPDLARIGRFCRNQGIYTVVDATQAAGNLRLYPEEMSLDFVAAGGQKWLMSPRGTGFLYVRADLIEELSPPVLGWMNVDYEGRFDDLLRYPQKLFDDTRRFELGTHNIHDILGLRQSLRLILGLGIEAIESHNCQLAASLRQRLEKLSVCVVQNSSASPTSILTFEVPDAQRREKLRRGLAQDDIGYAFREGRFRLAFHLYNDSGDVERAWKSIQRAFQARLTASSSG